MKTYRSIFAALALAITPALAMGQSMAELDTNDDGFLTAEEVRAANPDITAEDFSGMDVNGDGVLDDAEVQAAQDMGLLEAPSTD